MTRPKVVLFDLGKVFVDFDWNVAARRIAERARLSPAELFEFIRCSPLLLQYESGHISNEQFFEGVREAAGYRGSIEDFAAAFSDIFSEITEMTRLHARVREKGVATYIFSNTNDFAISHIRRTFPFFAGFDGYFLSYELGVMKPLAGIYEIAERTTGCAGREILYLDDLPENVAAGAARGWETILHVSPDETIPLVENSLFRNGR